MGIKRYDGWIDGEFLSGGYVKYADHVAEVANLNSALTAMAAQVSHGQAEIERLTRERDLLKQLNDGTLEHGAAHWVLTLDRKVLDQQEEIDRMHRLFAEMQQASSEIRMRPSIYGTWKSKV